MLVSNRPVASTLTNHAKPSNVQTNLPARPLISAHGTELSIWVRMGIPACLALLAAALNVAAVRSQIRPCLAYALAVDIPAGTQLKPEHLKTVEVAGNLDLAFLVAPSELMTEVSEHGRLTLEESLHRNPRVLSKAMGKGELLTRSSLGGLALSELRNGERMVPVVRSMITGSHTDLTPEQPIYFIVKRQAHQHTDQSVSHAEIGPFRILLRENAEHRVSESRDATLPLVYAVNDQGQPTASSQSLLDALRNDHKLILVLKPNHRN